MAQKQVSGPKGSASLSEIHGWKLRLMGGCTNGFGEGMRVAQHDERIDGFQIAECGLQNMGFGQES